MHSAMYLKLTYRLASRGLLAILFIFLLFFSSEIYNFIALPGTMRFSIPHFLVASSSIAAGFAGRLGTSSSSSVASPQTLRIMPLGASITTGYGSSDGNGYRQHLSDYLESDGHEVHFVGSQHNGNMSENHFEAWSGRVISQLFGPVKAHVPVYKPNLVLILLGNNDCKWHLEDAAHERMGNLTETIFTLLPNTTVIVAQLPPNTAGWVDKNIRNFNEKIVPILTKQRDAGRSVAWVDAHTPLSKTEDMSDDTHPNDKGFEKIAKVYYDGIRDVLKKGWVESPLPLEGEARWFGDISGELKRQDD